MSVSHAYFYSFRIIFTFQRSLPAVLDIITQDSERLYIEEYPSTPEFDVTINVT